MGRAVKWMKPGVAILLACLACAAATDATARPGGRKQADQPPKPTQDILTPKDKEFPTGTTWALKSFNDKPVPVAEDLTFSIDKEYRGTGYSGCNTWSATIYPIKQQRLLVGPFALTRKQCEKPKMQFETSFLAALRASPNWDLVDGDLVIKGQQGATMRFQRSI
jgi:heat shock protein HslJ